MAWLRGRTSPDDVKNRYLQRSPATELPDQIQLDQSPMGSAIGLILDVPPSRETLVSLGLFSS